MEIFLFPFSAFRLEFGFKRSLDEEHKCLRLKTLEGFA